MRSRRWQSNSARSRYRKICTSSDDDRHVAQTGREKIAGAIHLSGMSDVLPRTMEDALLLGPEHFGIHVPTSGQRIAPLKCDRQRRVGSDHFSSSVGSLGATIPGITSTSTL